MNIINRSALLVILAGWAVLATPALAQPYAYIANLGSDTVSVVDATTQSVVSTVPVGNDPDGVAVTPDGARVYVANFLSDNVSVIDTSTNTVAATIDVGSGPVGVAVTPDGAFVYVTNRGANTLSVINVATNALVATIPVGAGPNAVAITPDGTAAYVTNSFTRTPGTVSVIDLHTNMVTQTVEVYRTPNRLAITPDGRSVYVGNFRSWNVAVIDTASNTVTATVPLFGRPSGVVVNPNGASVYVTTLGGSVAVIDTATNALTNVIGVGDNPYGIATSHNGGAGYVANFASGTLSVLDLGDEVGSATVAVGDRPFAVAVSCVGSGCTEPPYTPRPTRTPTETLPPTVTPTVTPTRPPTLTPTPVPSPIRLDIGPVNGFPGQLVTITVTLRTRGSQVVATQNDLDGDPSTPINVLPNGKPDCVVSPDINKTGTGFAFQPANCTPDLDCTVVRAIVVSLDNTDPIPDGAVLYTCNVRILTETPPGVYQLNVSNASGSTPTGMRLRAEMTSGEISVGTPPGATPVPTHTLPPLPPTVTPTATVTATPTTDPATLVAVHVGTATGSAGQRVQFTVTLDTKGYAVAAVQNDVTFDRSTAIAARTNGKPNCTVNPALGKNASGFAFQPPGCTGNCQGMRAVILAIDNQDPIPDGAVVYTCSVDIAPGAAAVSYPLRAVAVIASSPAGARIGVIGTDGQIIVSGPSNQGLQSQGGAASASGGCQVTNGGGSATPLLAVALLVAVRWRRTVRTGGRH